MKLTRLEWTIVLMCGGFALTSFLVDPLSAFNAAIDVHSKCPVIRATSQWAELSDPLWLANPPLVRGQTGLSVFVYGPLYVMIIVALFRQASWIRLPALLLSGALTVNVLAYVIGSFIGYHVNHPLLFVAVNLPYVLLPVALIKRFGAALS
jgi:hypothetical protein